MYMRLSKDEKLLCEVMVNTHLGYSDFYFLDISSYFNIENVLNVYENQNIDKSEFVKQFAYIQSWRKLYNEKMDKEFPIPNSYDVDDDDGYKELKKDEGKIIEIIRNRLHEIAKRFDLEYGED